MFTCTRMAAEKPIQVHCFVGSCNIKLPSTRLCMLSFDLYKAQYQNTLSWSNTTINYLGANDAMTVYLCLQRITSKKKWSWDFLGIKGGILHNINYNSDSLRNFITDQVAMEQIRQKPIASIKTKLHTLGSTESNKYESPQPVEQYWSLSTKPCYTSTKN